MQWLFIIYVYIANWSEGSSSECMKNGSCVMSL